MYTSILNNDKSIKANIPDVYTVFVMILLIRIIQKIHLSYQQYIGESTLIAKGFNIEAATPHDTISSCE